MCGAAALAGTQCRERWQPAGLGACRVPALGPLPLPRFRRLDVIAHLVYRVSSALSQSSRFWQLLDGTGITIFVGPNGSGKSLCAVISRLDVLAGKSWLCFDAAHVHHAGYRAHQLDCEECVHPSLVARRRRDGHLEQSVCRLGLLELEEASQGQRLVYSTVALIDPETGDDHPLYRPLLDYRQLLGIEHAEVIFDEVAGISDASESAAIPVQVVNWLHTLRKSDVRMAVTTPAYARCSKPIRQVAQVVVDARSFFPEARTPGRLWRPRRMFAFVAYDAFEFEDFTTGTKEKATSLGRAVFWRPGHPAERHYDTLGQVLALGHVTEAGLCSSCGGARSRPKCACPVDHGATDVELVVEETVSASGARVRRAVPVELEPPAPETASPPPRARRARGASTT